MGGGLRFQVRIRSNWHDYVCCRWHYVNDVKKGIRHSRNSKSLHPKIQGDRVILQICEKYGVVGSCFPNTYFPSETPKPKTWEIPTKELNTTCADGYCPCPAQ